MNLPAHVAKHLREAYSGNNWTWSDLKENLADLTWQEATTKLYDLNTIAVLTYHVSYYVGIATQVIRGGRVESKHEESFIHPPINSQEDWDKLRDRVFKDAEALAELIEALPEEQLWETFISKKYGVYYRNLHGNIEHTYYHMGQIALLKKMIRQQASATKKK